MAAPAKHSPRQIEELIERIETLYELGVHRHLIDAPDDLLRRYARRLSSRPPSAGRLIREPLRTIEVAYFLRYCLLTCTDRVLLMVRRRVADLWRRAAKDANQVLIHWADLYRELLGSLGALVSCDGQRDPRTIAIAGRGTSTTQASDAVPTGA
jgi:hypothetical protein